VYWLNYRAAALGCRRRSSWRLVPADGLVFGRVQVEAAGGAGGAPGNSAKATVVVQSGQRASYIRSMVGGEWDR